MFTLVQGQVRGGGTRRPLAVWQSGLAAGGGALEHDVHLRGGERTLGAQHWPDRPRTAGEEAQGGGDQGMAG